MAEHSISSLEGLKTALRAAFSPASVLVHQPLAKYTSLRVGGPADLLVIAESSEGLCRSVQLAWERGVPCRVLGSGCNVLVSDAGIRGLVVLNRARAVAVENTDVAADSGASLSTLAQQCVRSSLAGLEWAANIPGTVGGAVVGNAGAWDGDVASRLVSATILEPPGSVVDWPVQRFEYGYRTSALKRPYERGRQEPVVLRARFGLQAGDRQALEAEVARITARRKATQPPGASCGSVHKNPPGDHAGRLIEAAGLKGQRIGNAEISAVHANFVINRGQATAAEIKALIDLVQRTVQERFGVALELEIQLIGEW